MPAIDWNIGISISAKSPFSLLMQFFLNYSLQRQLQAMQLSSGSARQEMKLLAQQLSSTPTVFATNIFVTIFDPNREPRVRIESQKAYQYVKEYTILSKKNQAALRMTGDATYL
ncbi:hypothetical protein ABPG72_019973 [Tetrahymena utriculariae]